MLNKYFTIFYLLILFVPLQVHSQLYDDCLTKDEKSLVSIMGEIAQTELRKSHQITNYDKIVENLWKDFEITKLINSLAENAKDNISLFDTACTHISDDCFEKAASKITKETFGSSKFNFAIDSAIKSSEKILIDKFLRDISKASSAIDICFSAFLDFKYGEIVKKVAVIELENLELDTEFKSDLEKYKPNNWKSISGLSLFVGSYAYQKLNRRLIENFNQPVTKSKSWLRTGKKIKNLARGGPPAIGIVITFFDFAPIIFDLDKKLDEIVTVIGSDEFASEIQSDLSNDLKYALANEITPLSRDLTNETMKFWLEFKDKNTFVVYLADAHPWFNSYLKNTSSYKTDVIKFWNDLGSTVRFLHEIGGEELIKKLIIEKSLNDFLRFSDSDWLLTKQFSSIKDALWWVNISEGQSLEIYNSKVYQYFDVGSLKKDQLDFLLAIDENSKIEKVSKFISPKTLESLLQVTDKEASKIIAITHSEDTSLYKNLSYLNRIDNKSALNRLFKFIKSDDYNRKKFSEILQIVNESNEPFETVSLLLDDNFLLISAFFAVLEGKTNWNIFGYLAKYYAALALIIVSFSYILYIFKKTKVLK